MFKKNSIKDGISIASAINDLYAKENLNTKIIEYFENNIQSMIDKYSEEHYKSPNLILQDILVEYLLYNRHRLGENLNVKSFGFKSNNYGEVKINKFCWAVLYLNNSDIKEPFKKSPQLVLYFKKEGISCSFSYGYNLKDDDEFVLKMNNRLIHYKKLIESPDTYISIRKNKDYQRIPLSTISDTDLLNLWSSDCILFTDISPKIISVKEPREQIISELDKYVQLFIEAIG